MYELLNIENYTLSSSFVRVNAIRGGSLILVRNDIVCKPREDVMSLSIERTIEVSCVEFQRYIIVCVYRPPLGEFDLFEFTMEDILKKICKTKTVIVCGDFNVDILQETTSSMSTTLASVPKYKLNNGLEIPAIALGTFLGFDENGVTKFQNKLLRDVILQAIDIGYRHFDTAAVYDTEGEIGEAVLMKIAEGAVKREDVFITNKLWNTRHGRDQVREALEDSLEKMGLEYVDLYLIHWPLGLNEDYTHSHMDYMETWRGMEDVQRLGLARSIGVSNFNKEQLQRVIEEGSIKPAVIQIEIHPQIIQKELVSYAQSQNIVVMGFSPFGSLVRRYGLQFEGPRFDNPVLMKIAQKYGKTTAQVVLRWLVDRNIIPIPKTVNYSRLKENINIFDFELNSEEIVMINKFDSNTRFTFPTFWQSHPFYPFERVENPIADPFVKN